MTSQTRRKCCTLISAVALLLCVFAMWLPVGSALSQVSPMVLDTLCQMPDCGNFPDMTIPFRIIGNDGMPQPHSLLEQGGLKVNLIEGLDDKSNGYERTTYCVTIDSKDCQLAADAAGLALTFVIDHGWLGIDQRRAFARAIRQLLSEPDFAFSNPLRPPWQQDIGRICTTAQGFGTDLASTGIPECSDYVADGGQLITRSYEVLNQEPGSPSRLSDVLSASFKNLPEDDFRWPVTIVLSWRNEPAAFSGMIQRGDWTFHDAVRPIPLYILAQPSRNAALPKDNSVPKHEENFYLIDFGLQEQVGEVIQDLTRELRAKFRPAYLVDYRSYLLPVANAQWHVILESEWAAGTAQTKHAATLLQARFRPPESNQPVIRWLPQRVLTTTGTTLLFGFVAWQIRWWVIRLLRLLRG